MPRMERDLGGKGGRSQKRERVLGSRESGLMGSAGSGWGENSKIGL